MKNHYFASTQGLNPGVGWIPYKSIGDALRKFSKIPLKDTGSFFLMGVAYRF
jgi:hypothetical protein